MSATTESSMLCRKKAKRGAEVRAGSSACLGKLVPVWEMGTHQGMALGSWADLMRESGACGQRIEGNSAFCLFIVTVWNFLFCF